MPRVLRRGKWSGAPSRFIRKVRSQAKAAMRRVMRSRRGPRQPVQYFKRSVYVPGATQANSTATVYGSSIFNLNAIPNATEFTNLYDQYKINLVKFQLIPRGNASDIQNGTTTGQSMGVFSAIDYDDNTAPTSIDELMQYQNMKMTRSHQIHKRVFKPRARINIVGAAGAGVNGQIFGSRNPWIDCNAPTVPHYCLKWALQQLPNGFQDYDLKVDYYLAFKNVR